jgi:DNA-directed RNA polymerase subunit RPC12/RpoP
MTTKHFECNECGAEGKIIVKGSDTQLEDIVYCPVCSGDIYEEDDFLDEDED